MTDTENIKKALSCCMGAGCTECPLRSQALCLYILKKGALDIINRYEAEIETLQEIIFRKEDLMQKIHNQKQVYYDELVSAKAEIERLTAEREKLLKECKKCGRRTQKAIGKLQKKIKTARAEAVKEFAERLKNSTCCIAQCHFTYAEVEYHIDNLVKEMVEQRKEDGNENI